MVVLREGSAAYGRGKAVGFRVLGGIPRGRGHSPLMRGRPSHFGPRISCSGFRISNVEIWIFRISNFGFWVEADLGAGHSLRSRGSTSGEVVAARKHCSLDPTPYSPTRKPQTLNQGPAPCSGQTLFPRPQTINLFPLLRTPHRSGP